MRTMEPVITSHKGRRSARSARAQLACATAHPPAAVPGRFVQVFVRIQAPGVGGT
jgi:hypothetical protein